ncbi:MAG: hypothetical protein JSU61_07390 [Fidelibacterota bacterium]|nr:MAG: hypothetical protein JSU61_07390 [Candidatus Neomarinimicrobiota bacterium]
MTESRLLTTVRGDQLEAVVAFPAGPGKAPGLVIAPGSSYGKEGPMIVSLFQQAVAADIAAVRFDWHYTTLGRQPSKDRRKEAEDLESVLSSFCTLSQVDDRRIVLAGKSLGAAVGYRIFRTHPEVAGAVLLTPVFRDDSSGQRNYPDLSQETRPLMILAGNRDPLNKLEVMHNYLGNAGKNVNVTIVDGDHGLNIFRGNDPDRAIANAENVTAAMEKVVHWLKATLAQR